MKKYDTDIFVSPTDLKPLKYDKGKLTDTANNTFGFWHGIPMLVPDESETKWHRELIEAILWEYPEELEEMYSRITHDLDPNPEYKNTIARLLKDKEGIKNALDRYADAYTGKWMTTQELSGKALRKSFRYHSSYSTGKKRVETKISPKDTFIYKSYTLFSDTCLKNSPETTVELATGAGGATAALAIHLSRIQRLYTVDIGVECLANALGIAKYTHKRKNIFPVCANFWHLPFKSEGADVVCTFCGLDESRENNKTLAEVKRILKPGGRFVCVSRKNAYMRQARILESFDFTESECIELLKKCRMYSSFDNLKEECRALGLEFIGSQEMPKDDKTVFVLSEFKKGDKG